MVVVLFYGRRRFDFGKVRVVLCFLVWLVEIILFIGRLGSFLGVLNLNFFFVDLI